MLTRHKLISLFFLIITGSAAGIFALSPGIVGLEEDIESVKQGRIEVNMGSIYYEELGSGEPLILIHGFPLTNRMWDDQFYELAKHFRVIRYDLRGYGLSSSQMEGYQFTHADDLSDLMYALDIEKAHIVGLTLGGNIGADMLVMYPEKVLSAVLINGNVTNLPGPSQPMTLSEVAQRDIDIVEINNKGIETAKRELLEQFINSGGSKREFIREKLNEMISSWDGWQFLHKEARVTGGMDTFTLLKEKHPDIPVLIIEGRSLNNKFPAKPEILDYLPKGEMLVLYDCGILLNMEQPDMLNKTILEFIRGK